MWDTFAKRIVKPMFRACGYDLVKVKNIFSDIRSYLPEKNLMIFDVGANTGQTVTRFRKELPRSTIHSFEPSPSTYEKLKVVASGEKSFSWNLGLGASPGRQAFMENIHSDMSSFLSPSRQAWGRVEKETMVEVTTVDNFCLDHKIDRINLLKSDTQGYDLEVFKGAKDMMAADGIDLIYFEVTFSDLYQNAPHFEEIFLYLNQNHFQLAQIYDLYRHEQALWTDALFVHDRFLSGPSLALTTPAKAAKA